MKLPFFDCDCSIGRMAIPQPGTFARVDELVAEMDYCGIGRALVYHNLARDHSPALGNKMLLRELAGHEQLEPCWVVMPHHTGEMPPPEQLLAEMRAAGVRAARIFPAATGHKWSLADWSAGPLFASLEAERVPLLVHADQIGWDALHRLGIAYPDLPIIVNSTRYDELRTVYPLLAALPNLHLDICWLVTHFGLEDLVARFGARRFLFGSRMPTFGAGPALTHLLYSGLSERDKALIAGANLDRLLAAAYSDSLREVAP
jgi:hypothetical protein